ncbi:MAG: hypothetical protein KBA55_04990 [Ruminococcus sp.]|nr:hypothetical protein [Ruminococcus sp.]
MKRFIIVGAAVLLCLSSCSFNMFRPKIESGTEVDNAHPGVAVNSSPVVMKTEPPAVSPYTDASEILCMVRHYSPSSFTKSDMIVQADGRIWCGFYFQNEGTIGADNVLRKTDGSAYEEFTLMDDKWMDAYLTEDAEDDFMLFGETFELGILSQSDLDKLKKYISETDPQSDTKAIGKQDTAAEDYYYTSITVEKNGSPVRMPVHADIGKYSITSSDSNAEKACKLVMNRSADYFKQWESLCEEKMTKDQ